MEHLGAAEAVEDLDAEALAPAREQSRRERLAGRHAETNAPEGRRQRGVGEHGGVERRHGEEDRRLLAGEQREHGLGRRPLGVEHGFRAEPERKGHAVAEAVGEEELRRGEQPIVGPERQHVARVVHGRRRQVAVTMDHTFRLARRAGGVEPERVVPGACRRRLRHASLRPGEALVADDDGGAGVRQISRTDPLGERGIDEERARLRVLSDERDVVRGQERRDRHGDDASP